MTSFKNTPRFSTLNYIKNQQSDIFIQKGLNKPEVEYKHKRFAPKNTYSTTYNFLEWKDTIPHQNSSIKMRQNPSFLSQILNSNISNLKKKSGSTKHKTFYEKMFENDPDNSPNISDIHINTRYQKETLDLGNYPGNEYKIIKKKSDLYDPTPYYKQKSPLIKKIDIIYGGSDNLIGSYKPSLIRRKILNHSISSIGMAHRDFETRNKYNPKIANNPKKMKYFLIYGNRGIENADKKLKPLSLSRSTNNAYVHGELPSQNRVNFFKSNIFNDKDVEKINNEDYSNKNNTIGNEKIKDNKDNDYKKLDKRTKSSNNFQKNINNNNHNDINNEKHGKRFVYQPNDEKLPSKLDWRNPNLYLYFPQSKNENIMKQNARQRKFNNIYGKDPAFSKEKTFEEFKSDNRPEIEEAAKNNYKNLTYSKIKKISDNISQMQ